VSHASPTGGSAPQAAFAMLGPLQAALAPRTGERILEVGAGGGYYAVEVAAGVGPGGKVDIVDAQPEMLAEAIRAAGERGLTNIAPTLGDARYLPFGDATFDAAYLVAALGDVPDQPAALRELGRVLREDGRLVVAELNGDPHRVSPARLRASAESAGLEVARQIDGLLGYVALLGRSARV
jgi:ubiquinone/menaquinone biosynthesis C-methylase UbiE